MNAYEHKLSEYIRDNNLPAEQLCFDVSCHSVSDAAKAVGEDEDTFVKNICLIDDDWRLICAIVKGEDRASTKRVAKALGIARPRSASPEDILKRTWFPCGGTPSFGYEALFLIDPKVMEQPYVYTWGGSAKALVKITPSAILEANRWQVVRVRK